MSRRGRVVTTTATPTASPPTGAAKANGLSRRHHDSSAHVDGWSNVITGLGTAARDKRLGQTFCADVFDQLELEEIYRGHDIAARIVDSKPNDAVRGGFKVLVAGDKDLATDLMASIGESGDDAEQPEGELPVLGHVHEALKWRRAYGGSGIILGVDDGQSPEMPLDETRIRSFDWMSVMSPYELQPCSWYADPQSARYGQARVYRVVPMVTSAGMFVDRNARATVATLSYVHESRVVPFQGIRVSRRLATANFNYGWGDSVLARCWRILKDFDLSWDSAAHLIADFSQAVLKTKGLFDLISSQDPADGDIVVNRAQMLDLTRSVSRMMLIDKDDEDFERKPTPLSGLPELMDRMCNRLSASCETPVTILMGQSPAGLNATGDSDIEMYYSRVDFERQREIKPALKRIVRLKMLAKDSPTGGVLPDAWGIKFPPLRLLDAPAQADVRLKTAQADEIEIRNQVVTPEEVALSRHGGEDWSSDTVLDSDLRDAQAASVDPSLAAPDGAIPGIDPKAALMGPQATAMLEIVRAVVNGEIPREAGVAMLAAGFPIDPATAEQIMADAGAGFVPKTAPPVAGAAGSAGPAGAAGAAGAPKPAGPAADPPKPARPVEVAPHERAGEPVDGHTRAAPEPAPAAKTDAKAKRKPRAKK